MVTLIIALIVLALIIVALFPFVGKLQKLEDARYQKNLAAGKYDSKDRLRAERKAAERAQKTA